MLTSLGRRSTITVASRPLRKVQGVASIGTRSMSSQQEVDQDNILPVSFTRIDGDLAGCSTSLDRYSLVDCCDIHL